MKKIIKFLHENKIGKVIKSIGIGALKGLPGVGNIVTEAKENQSDSLSGFGKLNIPRAVTYAGVSILFIARIVFPEHINAEIFNSILNIFNIL